MRIALLAALIPAVASAQASDEVLVMRIAPVVKNLYVISGFTNGNIAVLTGKHGLFLVDGQSGKRVSLADSALRTVTKLPVKLLVNTHYHADHIEGNPHWRAQGARIIAQDQVPVEARKDTIIAEWEDWHREPAEPEALPDTTFTDSLDLKFEGSRIRLLHPPNAHTSGDAVIWFRDLDVIHTGDLLEREAPPFLDWWAGGTLDGMINGIDLILAHSTAKTRFIPGHGTVATRDEVVSYRGMLVTMRDRVKSALAKDMSLDEFLATNPTREFDAAFGSARRGAYFARLLYVGLSRARQESSLHMRLQQVLDSLRGTGRFPGVTAGVAFADGRVIGLASGLSDTALGLPMQPNDLLLAGSVGKTYVAAVALQLVNEGKLDLDAPISQYLEEAPWFDSLPNARDITVRMLMNHTSGLMRYEFKEQFTSDLTTLPDKTWQPLELVRYIFGAKAPFPAGAGWDYSDTNYIVLGIIIERVSGNTLYKEIWRRLLAPLGLWRTRPASSRYIKGLVQGYAGPNNPFGGTNAMISNGQFVINPQFEWAGGGFATSAPDLARWACALYGGSVLGDSGTARMTAGVAAPMLGPGTTYGLGVIIRQSPLGQVYGHSGFFPGYQTDVRYFPAHRLAVAFQINSSAPKSLGQSPGQFILTLARTALTQDSLSSN